MKIANVDGRACLLSEEGVADLEQAAGGRLPSDPQLVLERWDSVREAVSRLDVQNWTDLDPRALRAPVPMPRQSFGVGLNYRAHAVEAGYDIPAMPLLFSKFPGCLTGATAEVELPSAYVDWEVELVVVIGRNAERVREEDALDVVAGFTIGQDISERAVQRSVPGPQLTLAKSYRTFGPCGPAIVTLDELDDPMDLAIECDLNGEPVQSSRTSDLIFGVAELIAFLSARMPLFAGDLIFTGTPSGVGSVREPPRYLTPGDEIVSRIQGLGTMRNRCRGETFDLQRGRPTGGGGGGPAAPFPRAS